jgi:hypothetical protein
MLYQKSRESWYIKKVGTVALEGNYDTKRKKGFYTGIPKIL